MHRLMVTVGDLSAGLASSIRDDAAHAAALAVDPRQRPALARPPAAAGGRGAPRRDAGRLRRAEPADVRPQRPAEAAGRRSASTPGSRTTNRQDRNRRSIYVLAKRNLRFPLFDAFDLPDMHNSCSRRSQTTTAPQALLLLNGEFDARAGPAAGRARCWRAHGDDRER